MFELESTLMNAAGMTSMVSIWIFASAAAFRRWRPRLLDFGTLLILIGFLALTTGILLRGLEARQFPISNLYESLLWFAWAIMGIYLWLSRRFDIQHLGWLISLTATAFFLYGSWLPADQHLIKPLMPALVSYWRQVHVPPLIVSYALFVIAGLCSIVQLWHNGRTIAVISAVAGVSACSMAIALGTFTGANVSVLQALFAGGGICGIAVGWYSLRKLVVARNYNLGALEADVSYRCISVGMPLLTIGIITGALWANHAWGTYWSWDPKETMSLVTWLSYSLYLHLGLKSDFSRDRLALVAISAMLLTLLTYLGFNALGFGGMHAYGNIK